MSESLRCKYAEIFSFFPICTIYIDALVIEDKHFLPFLLLHNTFQADPMLLWNNVLKIPTINTLMQEK
jgi:hypothetical protein